MAIQSLRALVKRIRSLVARFMPSIDPVGDYDEIASDSIAVVALLVHAELQYFLERRCLEVADHSINCWIEDNHPRTTLISLVAYCHKGGGSALPETLVGAPSSIREIVAHAKGVYSSQVARNNGIKEADLIQLLLPIGVREYELPFELTASLDWLGSRRGNAAHVAIADRMFIDPQELRASIIRILWQLKRLDQRLIELRDE